MQNDLKSLLELLLASLFLLAKSEDLTLYKNRKFVHPTD
jgi:hypothetical protein